MTSVMLTRKEFSSCFWEENELLVRAFGKKMNEEFDADKDEI